MKKIYFTISLILIIQTVTFAQQWGKYTLIGRGGYNNAKLVDPSGAVYKSWTFTGSTVYSCFLTPDRCIIRIAGGSGTTGSRVEKINWDGQIVWSFNVAAHHDICCMPNGNVLATVLTSATAAEAAAIGLSISNLKYDRIVEINGVSGQIVWEWRFIDHTIQNTNSSLANYGDPAANPQRFNVARSGTQGYSDWNHLNGLDYYPQRDQIVICCRHNQEIFVIDHSTTTAEAKGTTGGLAGKGGDFLYRWGNPANYGKTGTTMGNIHDATWCLTETYQGQSQNEEMPNYHKFGQMISVWSNTNVGGIAFAPPYIDNDFNFSYVAGTAYAPTAWARLQKLTGQSTNMGGAQFLPNGNMLLYAGAGMSTCYEYNYTGSSIWTYNNQVNGVSKVTRYSERYVAGELADSCRNVPIGVLPNPGVTYTINASVNNQFYGNISPSGNHVVNSGENISFSITPNNQQSKIDSVLVNNINQGILTNYTFTNVQANATIKAFFSLIPIITYNIIASTNDETLGTISPSGTITINSGENQEFAISTNKINVQIDSVIVNNQNVGAITTYTFINLQENSIISAYFSIDYSNIENNAKQKLTFKNPVRAGETLIINHLEENQNNKIEIYNFLGKLCAQQIGNNQIQIPNVPNGIYFLKINQNSYKLIIQ